MFVHHCSACQKRQLVFFSQLTSMENTEAGIEVSLTCWCGSEQTLRTGRAFETADARTSASATAA
jgi:hypothetical protein